MSVATRIPRQFPERNGHGAFPKAVAPPPANSAVLVLGLHQIMVELVEVTPELAAEWFEKNISNRPLNDRTWQRYARMLAEQSWILNGDTIVFDRDGVLRNGQHRLKACIASGKPFITLVVHGVDPAAFSTYDRNRGRAGADVLAIKGRKNGFLHSAALAHLWRHLNKMHGTTRCPESYEIDAIDSQHPGMVESVRVGKAFANMVSPATVAFCHYVFTPQDPDRSAQFFDQLLKGTGLTETSPVYLLRKRILQVKLDKKTRMHAWELLALFFKAWVAYRDRKPMKNLRWRTDGDKPEPFPSID